MLYSNSHHAIFIKELFNKSPQISGYAYVSLSNQHTTCSWNSYFAFQGVLESELHLRGINEKTRSHTEKALEDIRGKTQLHLDEYTRKENELVRKISETLQKTEGMLRDKKKEFEDTLTLKSEEFSKFHQDSSDRFENINKTYREHIALKAPVEFWGDLRFYSYIRASIAFIIAALYTYFAGDFVIRQANKVGLLTKDDVSYGKIIFFVLLASAFIWILRIIFRYLVGQLHVANESTEKMVMTKTYMALLEDGKLEITERELVLKNVFRPSGSGLIGDDHPHPAMEIINNIQRPK